MNLQNCCIKTDDRYRSVSSETKTFRTNSLVSLKSLFIGILFLEQD